MTLKQAIAILQAYISWYNGKPPYSVGDAAPFGQAKVAEAIEVVLKASYFNQAARNIATAKADFINDQSGDLLSSLY